MLIISKRMQHVRKLTAAKSNQMRVESNQDRKQTRVRSNNESIHYCREVEFVGVGARLSVCCYWINLLHCLYGKPLAVHQRKQHDVDGGCQKLKCG